MTLARLEKEIISIRAVSESENTKVIAEAFNHMNWAKRKESGIWYIRCISRENGKETVLFHTELDAFPL